MNDDAIFRMLYVPGAVERRTKKEKVHDRRKYEIASALRQELGGGSPLLDDLWRFCLMVTEVFMGGEEDVGEFVDRSKRNNPGGSLDTTLTRAGLTGAAVAAFLLETFPHYHGEKAMPWNQDIAEQFGDELATLTPSENRAFNATLQSLMRDARWDHFSRDEQLAMVKRILEDRTKH